MNDNVGVVVSGGVMDLRLDRAAKRNALTGAMYAALTAALAGAAADDGVAAVSISGAGEGFCAGNDLGDFLAGPEGAEAALAFVRALAAFQKPVVAAVQGAAVGIGTTMLFHCDLVYAAPDARFAMPFVDLGLVPEAGASLLAPATMGPRRAAAMLLLGEAMGAEDAVRAGLVNAVVPAGDLYAHARARAATLAAKPREALRRTRRLLRGDPAAIDARIAEEARLFRAALASADAREAFAAFVEKRAPVFGR